jgi:hypothetical protein
LSFPKNISLKNIFQKVFKSFSEIEDEKFVILIVGDQDIATLKNLFEVTMKATHSKTKSQKLWRALIPLQGNKRDLSLSRHKNAIFIQIILLQF